MKERNQVVKISIVVFLIVISLYFDRDISKGILLIQNNTLTDFFLGITQASSAIIIFFFLTSLFLWQDNKRKWILPLWVSLISSAAVSFILKFSIKRLRPYQLGITNILPVLEKASHVVWNFSFPSFQAMLPFAAVPILSKEFPRFKYVWIVLASLIALSRVYFGLHFLSDVLAGGLIGYVIGSVIVMLEKRNKFGEEIYLKLFKRS